MGVKCERVIQVLRFTLTAVLLLTTVACGGSAAEEPIIIPGDQERPAVAGNAGVEIEQRGAIETEPNSESNNAPEVNDEEDAPSSPMQVADGDISGEIDGFRYVIHDIQVLPWGDDETQILANITNVGDKEYMFTRYQADFISAAGDVVESVASRRVSSDIHPVGETLPIWFIVDNSVDWNAFDIYATERGADLSSVDAHLLDLTIEPTGSQDQPCTSFQVTNNDDKPASWVSVIGRSYDSDGNLAGAWSTGLSTRFLMAGETSESIGCVHDDYPYDLQVIGYHQPNQHVEEEKSAATIDEAAASQNDQTAPEPPESTQGTEGDEGDPAVAAREWLKARTTDDVDTAVKLSCPAHQSEVRSTSEWIAEVNAQTGGRAEELSDISNVTFETLTISGDTADVLAQGAMTVAFQGEPLTTQMEQTYLMKMVGDAWLYCGVKDNN